MGMQAAAGGSIVERMIGAARLDARTYEEVEHDSNATPQAAIVVVLAAIATGIGAIREDGFGGLIGGVISGLIGWALFAGLCYFIGTRVLGTAQTSASWSEVARPLGFSYAPNILGVLGFIPGIGPLIAALASIWALVAGIIAIRQSLDFSTGRAIGTAVIAFLVVVVVIAIIAGIIGLSIYGIEN